MFQSVKMAGTIEAILAGTGHNLATMYDGQSVRIQHAPFMGLVISRISATVVHVEHGFVQNGDWMQDPGMRFFTGYRTAQQPATGWIALDLTQDPVGAYTVGATTDAGSIVGIAPETQRAIGTFAEQWARNLRAQGWVPAKATPKQLQALATIARVNGIPAERVEALSVECFAGPMAQLTREQASLMFTMLLGLAAGDQAA